MTLQQSADLGLRFLAANMQRQTGELGKGRIVDTHNLIKMPIGCICTYAFKMVFDTTSLRSKIFTTCKSGKPILAILRL